MGDKLEMTGKRLLQWNYKKFKGMRQEIDKLTKELNVPGSREPNGEELVEEQNKRKLLNTLLDKEETFWY